MLTLNTKDPDEFQDFLSGVTPGTRTSALDASSFQANTRMVPLSRSAIFSVGGENMHVLSDRPCGFMGLTVPLDVGFRASSCGTSKVYEPGFGHVVHPTDGLDFQLKCAGSILVAYFSRSALDHYGQAQSSLANGSESGISDTVSFQTPAGQHLWRYLSFLWSEANLRSNLLKVPLALEEHESTLLTLLALAGDEKISALADDEVRPCAPRYLKRAEDYVASRLKDPATLAEIAQASGVSIPTLTRAFREQHGVGPVTYLRRLRIEAAQRELLAADPETRTVTEIAATFGFWDFGRFAAQYRRVFGENPSETLSR